VQQMPREFIRSSLKCAWMAGWMELLLLLPCSRTWMCLEDKHDKV